MAAGAAGAVASPAQLLAGQQPPQLSTGTFVGVDVGVNRLVGNEQPVVFQAQASCDQFGGHDGQIAANTLPNCGINVSGVCSGAASKPRPSKRIGSAGVVMLVGGFVAFDFPIDRAARAAKDSSNLVVSSAKAAHCLNLISFFQGKVRSHLCNSNLPLKGLGC